MLKGLKALLTGLVAGTAIGVLFSPEDGKSIRKGIKDELDEGGTGLNTVKKTLKGMGDDIQDTSKKTYKKVNDSEEIKRAKKKAKELYNEKVPAQTKKKITKVKKEAEKTVKKAKKSVSTAKKKAINLKKKATSKIKKKK